MIRDLCSNKELNKEASLPDENKHDSAQFWGMKYLQKK
jgi:hypothetical protein